MNNEIIITGINIGIAGSGLGGIFGNEFSGTGNGNDGTSQSVSDGNGATANSGSNWSSWSSGFPSTSGNSELQSTTGSVHNGDWSSIQNGFNGAGSNVNTNSDIASGIPNGAWGSNSQAGGGRQNNFGQGIGAGGNNQHGGENAQSISHFFAPSFGGKQSGTSSIGVSTDSDASVNTGASRGLGGLTYNSNGGSYNSGGFSGPSTSVDPSGSNSYSYSWSS